MKNAKNQNREIYVFVGQNASCGTPHSQTGRMSMYGKIYRIDGTLRQAREWAEHMYYRNGNSRITVAGGRRKMREFCLGSTMYMFEQDLYNATTVYANDDENVQDWHVS